MTKFLVDHHAVDLLMEVANRSEAPRLTVSLMQSAHSSITAVDMLICTLSHMCCIGMHFDSDVCL